MTVSARYQAPNLSVWQGRTDTPTASCLFQLVNALDLTKSQSPIEHNHIAFAIIGFCSDEGIRRNQGRTGAKDGPDAIRQMLARLPVQRTTFTCYDAGNIVCDDGDLEAAQAELAKFVSKLIRSNIIPIVLGGGHEVAWGHYQGIEHAYPHERLGIVNFDAHWDMRPLLPHKLGSSGTPFLQIAQAHKAAKRHFDYNCIGIQHASNIHQLFETAHHWHANMILADDLHMGYMDKCVNFIDRIIDQNDIIYLSICLDVFATAFAPGVSAPQALGLAPWQVIPLVRQLATSGKVVSYDIAEMSPALDQDQRTARLAASLVYEIMHHHKKGSNYGNNSTT